MKNSHNNIFLEWKKNIYGKNISYWIQNYISYWIQSYFDWTKIYLDNMKKNSNMIKKVFHWIQIYSDWIKIYFDIMKKSDITKKYFIEYKSILLE